MNRVLSFITAVFLCATATAQTGPVVIGPTAPKVDNPCLYQPPIPPGFTLICQQGTSATPECESACLTHYLEEYNLNMPTMLANWCADLARAAQLDAEYAALAVEIAGYEKRIFVDPGLWGLCQGPNPDPAVCAELYAVFALLDIANAKQLDAWNESQVIDDRLEGYPAATAHELDRCEISYAYCLGDCCVPHNGGGGGGTGGNAPMSMESTTVTPQGNYNWTCPLTFTSYPEIPTCRVPAVHNPICLAAARADYYAAWWAAMAGPGAMRCSAIQEMADLDNELYVLNVMLENANNLRAVAVVDCNLGDMDACAEITRLDGVIGQLMNDWLMTRSLRAGAQLELANTEASMEYIQDNLALDYIIAASACCPEGGWN